MIRKLRIKLVTAAMLSLLAVLTAIIGTAGWMNYKNIVTEADQKLLILTGSSEQLQDKSLESMQGMTADTKYEMRYFTAVLNEDNTVQSVNVTRISAVDASQAAAYAEEIAAGDSDSGFIDSYRYLVYQDSSGRTCIAFLSCFRDLRSFRSFMLTCTGMSLLGSLAVLILLIITSGKIVKPVSDSYEKQKRFITDAGHELRTPLTIISADAEVLEMDYGESEWLDDIRSQTRRLSDLTSDLVLLTRMEEQPDAEKIQFSLSRAAEETAAEFEMAAAAKGIRLNTSIEPEQSMLGNERNIRTLMRVLLDNAVKYTDESGTISLTLDRWKNQTRIRVFNTTEHIEKASMEHLFDRFYRTDQSRNSATGGYGLGLSIAAAVTGAHGGKITASTEDEKSLLITAVFP